MNKEAGENHKSAARCPVCNNFASTFPDSGEINCRYCENLRFKRSIAPIPASSNAQLKREIDQLLRSGFRSPEWVAHRLNITAELAKRLMFD